MTRAHGLLAPLVLAAAVAQAGSMPKDCIVRSDRRAWLGGTCLFGTCDYSYLLVEGEPVTLRKNGVNSHALTAAVTQHLTNAGISVGTPARPGKGPVLRIRIDIGDPRLGAPLWSSRTRRDPAAQQIAWSVAVEVREPARLERDPAHSAVVVSWEQRRLSLSPPALVSEDVTCAVDELLSGLLKAHEWCTFWLDHCTGKPVGPREPDR
jgi:hypothetical protein